MSKIHRIDLVVIPRRGKKRVYAIGPLTVGTETFDYLEGMIQAFEQRAKRYSVPIPRRRAPALTIEVDGTPIPIRHIHRHD
jgi:hypothetical protein